MSGNVDKHRGFTLVEALLATALMGAILAALATVTAQWLPNWNRGFARVQRAEQLALGLERLVADLAAADSSRRAASRMPVFDGTDSVTFLRTALGPNTRPGLESCASPRPAASGADHWCARARRSCRSPRRCRPRSRARRSGRAGARALSRHVFLCGRGSRLARSGAARANCRSADPRDGARRRDRTHARGLDRDAGARADAGRMHARPKSIAECLTIGRPRGATGRAARAVDDALRRLHHAPRAADDGFIVVAVLWILGALAMLASIYLDLCRRYRDRVRGAQGSRAGGGAGRRRVELTASPDRPRSAAARRRTAASRFASAVPP